MKNRSENYLFPRFSITQTGFHDDNDHDGGDGDDVDGDGDQKTALSWRSSITQTGKKGFLQF